MQFAKDTVGALHERSRAVRAFSRAAGLLGASALVLASVCASAQAQSALAPIQATPGAAGGVVAATQPSL